MRLEFCGVLSSSLFGALVSIDSVSLDSQSENSFGQYVYFDWNPKQEIRHLYIPPSSVSILSSLFIIERFVLCQNVFLLTFGVI